MLFGDYGACINNNAKTWIFFVQIVIFVDFGYEYYFMLRLFKISRK